jgi:hypothetical protein
MTIIGTTPMGRRGYIGELFDMCHGDNDNIHTLCWQAPSLVMNPTLDRSEIALAFKLDPIKAAAELGAEFRSEFDALITHEALDLIHPTAYMNECMTTRTITSRHLTPHRVAARIP